MLRGREKLAARRSCERKGESGNIGPTGGFKKGMCEKLGTNVFDCGYYSSIAQMENTWKNIKLYVGMKYGPDICDELHNLEYAELLIPRLPQETLDRHEDQIKQFAEKEELAQQERMKEIQVLKRKAQSDEDHEATTELAEAQKRFANMKKTLQSTNTSTSPITLTDTEKIIHAAEWKTYMERQANLQKHRGQVFCMMLGQCSQRLHNRLQQDNDWERLNTSYDPVDLYQAIRSVVYKQEYAVPNCTPKKTKATPTKQYDKQYWKGKECYKCHKSGHPASACRKQDYDDRSSSSQADSNVNMETEEDDEVKQRSSKRNKEESQY